MSRDSAELITALIICALLLMMFWRQVLALLVVTVLAILVYGMADAALRLRR